MKCKQGELAVVVKSKAGNEGKIITCLRLATEQEIEESWICKEHAPWWVTDKPLRFVWGKDLEEFLCFAYDDQLMPLRGDLSEDATEEEKELEILE